MRIHGRDVKREMKSKIVTGRRSMWSSLHAGPAPGALMLGVAVTLVCMLTSSTRAMAGYCSQTADTLLAACKAGVTDDSLVKKATCINISNGRDRNTCFDELAQEQTESRKLCEDQHDWRLDACELLGEGRFDPDFDRSDFDADFRHLTRPNPYFPLRIGNRWTYRGAGELNTIEVLNQTKSIEDVTCIVVRDQVFKNGSLAENTDDWYAQALNGNVWYFGEEVKDFESFPGDRPPAPELVSIDGSFKAGRNGDKPGIIFLASPRKDAVYLEEFSLGNAEDVTLILTTTYGYGRNAELDQLVPRQLADRFCSARDCVVTKNFSLLEPDIFARKYYARGIGVFLEVEPDTQTVSQLVDCSFDPRCTGLPTP